MQLVLASASPRRAQLLQDAGFSFETRRVDVDEQVRPGEPPADYVRRLAMEKSARALDAVGRRGGHLVLGADTAVVVDGDIFGKPSDGSDAARMLGRLSGRSHEVFTGISLRGTSTELGLVEASRVFFAPLAPDEIEWYVRSGEGSDKAGAYAIQGLGSRFVTRIEGSYSNVVGLPVASFYALWRQLGCSMDVLAS